ncbi:MAG: hypothetical protein V2A73_20040, partial [Pseudomonadota bacterium]
MRLPSHRSNRIVLRATVVGIALLPDPALARLKTTPPPLDLGAAASPRRPPSEETSDGSSL